MIYTTNYDFSFSGLKTAVLYEFKKRPKKIRKSKVYLQTMCAEIQQAIIDVLVYKTIKAAKNLKVKSIILGGGVAANEELRRQLREKIKKEIPGSKFYVPAHHFCTDNAAMIALTTYLQQKEGLALTKGTINWQKIKADANLRV